jgi:hypothetical protein
LELVLVLLNSWASDRNTSNIADQFIYPSPTELVYLQRDETYQTLPHIRNIPPSLSTLEEWPKRRTQETMTSKA